MSPSAQLHPSFSNGTTVLCAYNDDTPQLFARWFSDQQLVSLMGDWEFYPVPYYDQTPAEYAKRTRKTTWLVCAAGETAPLPIGYAGLYLQPRHRVGIMRLAIAEPAYRRQGHGRRATAMTIGWAFESLDLFALHLSVTASNPAALALYRQAGFRECGRYRASRFELAGRFDEIHMELLREEWSGARRDERPPAR